MMFYGMIFLLLGMKSVLVISTNASEADNVTKSINLQVEYPCKNANSYSKENCSGSTPSIASVNRYFRFVNALKNDIKRIERTYNETHYKICQNAERMNATMDYLNNNKFCEIPLTMVDQDMSHSSPNMRQITKWILWLEEAEKKVGSSEELGYKLHSIGAYAMKIACYQGIKHCIEESDVQDVINCTLPPIVANADPQDLIPISCHVLSHIHNYTQILKRSIRLQMRQAKKNKKKCKKGGKKSRKNRKERNKKARRNCKEGKRRNMSKRKNGTRRGCRKCKNQRN
ncbi:hypothetical protein LOTGIDRAFT_174014 [Lottia gigantea]|uniref:Uncharacterized protein n=1 Tax=Lottia gigantea TaxID=225164 RepID=V4CB05_LOTGI|nr:hypothetical protein LOTGIDRAFT_174014 [Lottia gigantea]ESO99014.1 hypothetical protein LOTGIDRAFT_174014 [Lottia gigantea]